MPMKDRLVSYAIGTPVQRPLAWLRWAMKSRKRWRHPELREIFLEDGRAEQIVRRTVTPGMNCVDVGCHLGSVLDRFTRLSPTGSHHAVEPIPYKAAWLRRKFPRVPIHQVALGREPGEVEFFINTKRSGFSGLRAIGGGPSERLTVARKRLDDVVPESTRVGFLKVDVEGGELDVFAGAPRILSRDRPTILFECAATGMRAFGFTGEQVFSAMTAYGYRVLLFKDFLANGPALALDEFLATQQYPFRAFNYMAVPI